MLEYRAFEPRDLDVLYRISLATGLAGGDASHLYGDPKLMGHIYSAPYARLAPGTVLVVEDDHGVGGFVAGVCDTHAWEEKLEREWWPLLRRQYPDPGETPDDRWTHDQRRCSMIHHPERTPEHVVERYPAHLHLNLFPRLQGRGLGSRLFDAWLCIASSCNTGAVHVGVSRANARGIRFWTSQGFQALEADTAQTGRTVWMGRKL